ncbi:MAG: hypothetical protein EON54_15730, partial [Alcaligenaceae bacterium]
MTTSDIDDHSTDKAGGYSVSGSVGFMAGGAAEQQQAMRDRGMSPDEIAKASNAKPGGSAGVGSASGSQTSTSKASRMGTVNFISLNYGWIDAQDNPIDISARMKAGGKEMADNVSKGASYAAAGCAALVVCAPAAPGIAAAGLGAGILKDLVFDRDATAFFADFGVDKVL